MKLISVTLTVFFEDPFWVGIFERIADKKLSVIKFVFGAMPKENEVYEFILKKYSGLNFNFSTDITIKQPQKKLKKQAQKQIKKIGIGTKSQIALKIQHKKNKMDQKKLNKEQKEIKKKYKFNLKQKKRKEKHKGR